MVIGLGAALISGAAREAPRAALETTRRLWRWWQNRGPVATARLLGALACAVWIFHMYGVTRLFDGSYLLGIALASPFMALGVLLGDVWRD